MVFISARTIFRPEAARQIIGSARHHWIFHAQSTKQDRLAAKFPIDYIAIGPVFPTETKEAPDPVVGLETLQLVREILGPIPLVAIGGITLENSQSVLAAGADAVAVISDIWRLVATGGRTSQAVFLESLNCAISPSKSKFRLRLTWLCARIPEPVAEKCSRYPRRFSFSQSNPSSEF